MMRTAPPASGQVVPAPLSAREDVELDLLLEAVWRCFGADYRGYRRGLLRAAIIDATWRMNLDSISALQARVLHDADAAALLFTDFARMAHDAEAAAMLGALRRLLPPLLRSRPFPRIWIAECVSAGSVGLICALLLETGVHARTEIFATGANAPLSAMSIDELEQSAAVHARGGGIAAFGDYCQPAEKGMALRTDVVRNVVWADYSIDAGASFNEFDLIVCRGVFRCFGDGLQERALAVFDASLSPCGLLAVDATDEPDRSVIALTRRRLNAIPDTPGLYRKIR